MAKYWIFLKWTWFNMIRLTKSAANILASLIHPGVLELNIRWINHHWVKTSALLKSWEFWHIWMPILGWSLISCLNLSLPANKLKVTDIWWKLRLILLKKSLGPFIWWWSQLAEASKLIEQIFIWFWPYRHLARSLKSKLILWALLILSLPADALATEEGGLWAGALQLVPLLWFKFEFLSHGLHIIKF